MDALADVVAASVQVLDLKPQDAGTAALAITYARQIDGGGEIKTVGPLLLATLDALLMTPKARAAVLKGATHEPAQSSPLDQLAARRAARNAG